MANIKEIIRSGIEVQFIFSDGSSMLYSIKRHKGNYRWVYLEGLNCCNDAIFRKLEINPESFYKNLGIFKKSGICPYCYIEDLEILFKALKEGYSVKEVEDIEFEEIKEPKEPSEYDWLF